MYFKIRGHRGYNICPWLKNGKREICGKSCREEYCKVHRLKIRNGSKILRPCLGCGIGIRSEIQLCRGCGRETERQRLNCFYFLLPDKNPFEDLQLKAFVQKGRISLFWPIFIFCRIKLIFGRLTCFDRKNFVL